MYVCVCACSCVRVVSVYTQRNSENEGLVVIHRKEFSNETRYIIDVRMVFPVWWTCFLDEFPQSKVGSLDFSRSTHRVALPTTSTLLLPQRWKIAYSESTSHTSNSEAPFWLVVVTCSWWVICVGLGNISRPTHICKCEKKYPRSNFAYV